MSDATASFFANKKNKKKKAFKFNANHVVAPSADGSQLYPSSGSTVHMYVLQ
jgi:hypothetical protein